MPRKEATRKRPCPPRKPAPPSCHRCGAPLEGGAFRLMLTYQARRGEGPMSEAEAVGDSLAVAGPHVPFRSDSVASFELCASCSRAVVRWIAGD